MKNVVLFSCEWILFDFRSIHSSHFILFICFLNSVLLLCWALYFYTILLNSIQNWYRPYFRRFLNIILFSFSLVDSIFFIFHVFSTTTKQIRNSIIRFQLLCLRNMLMWCCLFHKTGWDFNAYTRFNNRHYSLTLTYFYKLKSIFKGNQMTGMSCYLIKWAQIKMM